MSDENKTGDQDENAAAGEQQPDKPVKEDPKTKTKKETEPAESGAGDEGGGDGGAAVDPGTGLDPKMHVEIDLATLATLRRVAATIARTCDNSLKDPLPRRLLLVPPSAAAGMAGARLLMAELDAVAGQIELLVDPSGATNESVVAAKAGAEAVKGIAGAVAASVKSVMAAVQALAVSESYSSRSVGLEETTLAAVIGGRLLEKGIQPIPVAGDSPMRGPEPRALTRVVAASAALRAATLDEAGQKAAQRLQERVEAAIAALSGTDAGASGLRALAAIEANPDLPVLVARAVSAGGAYRIRTHLFTMLGMADRLSFSAGAAIAFSLSDAQGKLLASDVLYHSGPRIRSPRAAWTGTLTNLHPDDLA